MLRMLNGVVLNKTDLNAEDLLSVLSSIYVSVKSLELCEEIRTIKSQ